MISQVSHAVIFLKRIELSRQLSVNEKFHRCHSEGWDTGVKYCQPGTTYLIAIVRAITAAVATVSANPIFSG